MIMNVIFILQLGFGLASSHEPPPVPSYVQERGGWRGDSVRVWWRGPRERAGDHLQTPSPPTLEDHIRRNLSSTIPVTTRFNKISIALNFGVLEQDIILILYTGYVYAWRLRVTCSVMWCSVCYNYIITYLAIIAALYLYWQLYYSC